MKEKIEKQIQDFDLAYRYTGEVADKILKVVKSELLKKLPKERTGWYGGCGYCPDCNEEEHECTCDGFNQALSEVKKLIESI